jgi:hypothetical protein
MTKAYLHIGVEKTGTTTIQSFMAKNRPALRQEGFFYPAAPGEENHVGLTLFAADDPNHLNDILPMAGVYPGTDLAAYSAQMLSNLKSGFDMSGCQALVLSNEHLSSRVRTEKSISKLGDALGAVADTVDVVVYLRRQDEVVLSEYSTRVKVGYTERFSLEPHHFRNYDYAALLDRWSAVFGRDHVLVRVFERASLRDGDLIADFLGLIHCPFNASFASVPPQNLSLDTDCLEYLRRLNRHLPAFVDGRPNSDRGDLVVQLAAISKGEKPRFGSAQADAILEYFAVSNRDVAIRYLQRPDGVLFCASRERAAEDNFVTLDDDRSFALTAALWRQLQSRS